MKKLLYILLLIVSNIYADSSSVVVYLKNGTTNEGEIVNFEKNNVSIKSEIADFTYLTETFSFSNASFVLNDNNSRGDAENIQINGDGVLNLNNVSYYKNW